VALVAALLVGCGQPSSSTGVPTASPAPTHTPPGTSSPGASQAPVPADMLECDGPVSDVGGMGEEISLQVVGGATPQEALEAFLATSPWVIPRSGYEPIAQAGNRHAYAFSVDGEVKVVVVVSSRFAHLVGAEFAADELRGCASGEYGSQADFGDGRRAWTHPDTGHVIHDIVGPSHCDWQSARLMHLEHPDGSLDRQYVRDPEGVLPADPLLEGYAEDVELPDGAADSGYRSPEGFELWFTEGDTAAYVVTPDGVERWPRAREPIGCS
jgi:hypothetical protein